MTCLDIGHYRNDNQAEIHILRELRHRGRQWGKGHMDLLGRENNIYFMSGLGQAKGTRAGISPGKKDGKLIERGNVGERQLEEYLRGNMES